MNDLREKLAAALLKRWHGWEWGDTCAVVHKSYLGDADAVMPVVREAVRNAAEMSWTRIDDHATDEDFDSIVRRVCGE